MRAQETDFPVYVHVPPFVYGEGCWTRSSAFSSCEPVKGLEELLRNSSVPSLTQRCLWKNLVDLTVNCLKHPVKDNVMKHIQGTGLL